MAYTALLWLLIKVLQLIFLFIARNFTHKPITIHLSKIRRLLVLYILVFLAEIIVVTNAGFTVIDWIANIGEVILLLNMVSVYSQFTRPDVLEIAISNDKEIELKKKETSENQRSKE